MVTHATPLRLGQILRPLYTKGIFSYEPATEEYALNHVSRLLLKDHATQWHNWVTLYGNQFFDIARGIPEAVKSGSTRCAAQVNFDTDLDMFAYFESQGWVPQLHKTLGGGAKAMAPGILVDYPWHEIGDKTVMDIGGGSGALLASLLRANPGMSGALFDRPAVIDHIIPFFTKGGQFEDLESRVPRGNLISGNFLEELPKYEAYTMKWCLHDWDTAFIMVDNRKIVGLSMKSTDSSDIVIKFEDGSEVVEGFLAHGPMGQINGPFAEQLGLELTPTGDIKTEGQMFETQVKGAFAVGDCATMMKAVSQAVGMGCLAAGAAAAQLGAELA